MANKDYLYAKIVRLKKIFFPGRIIPEKYAQKIDNFFRSSHLLYENTKRRICIIFWLKQKTADWYGKPWMQPYQINTIESALLSFHSDKIDVLEWGAGGSTIYFTDFLKRKKINYSWLSIEHDKNWFKNIKQATHWNKKIKIVLRELDTNDPLGLKWKKYVTYPQEGEKKFDLIIVDGIERNRCIEESKTLLKENGIVFLHDAERIQYHSAFHHFPKSKILSIRECESQLWRGLNKKTGSTLELKKNNSIALVSVVKNEGPYLAEWLAYHLMLGVDHIYLYDDWSNDNSSAIYELMQKTGKITVLKALKTGRTRCQQDDCFEEWRRHYGQLYDFVMPWDADEFLVLKDGLTLKDFLEAIPQDVGQVRINWKTFGSSGHLFKDDSQLVIERFTKHADVSSLTNKITKLIIKLQAIHPAKNIYNHCTTLKPEYHSVASDLTTKADNTQDEIDKIIWDGLATCYHYRIKSFEEFINKQKRGVTAGLDITISHHYFLTFNQNKIEDKTMLKYVQPIKDYITNIKK